MNQQAGLRVEVLSGEPDHGTLLTDEERAEITSELAPDLAVEWVPPETRLGALHDPTRLHFSHETVVLFFLAVAQSPFGRRFQELIADELWNGLKRLVSRILKRQEEAAYRVQSAPYLVLDAPDYALALELAATGLDREGDSIEKLADAQEAALRWYDEHWDEVAVKVEELERRPYENEQLADRKIFLASRPGDLFAVRRITSLESILGGG